MKDESGALIKSNFFEVLPLIVGMELRELKAVGLGIKENVILSTFQE